MIIYRIATEKDVDTIFEIRTSVKENFMSIEQLSAIGITHESVKNMIKEENAAWIAEINGTSVGFSMADKKGKTIFALFVLPQYKNRGIGKNLLRRAEEWLFQQGADEIWLSTGENPEIKAHGFYKHNGWEPTGRTDDGQISYVKART